MGEGRPGGGETSLMKTRRSRQYQTPGAGGSGGEGGGGGEAEGTVPRFRFLSIYTVAIPSILDTVIFLTCIYL